MRSNLLVEKLLRQEAEELILEEVPDITYADVGDWTARSRPSPTPWNCPTCTGRCSTTTTCQHPRHIALRPAGVRKTLIAKAVANSLSQKVAELTGNRNVRSYFLNIKAPNCSTSTSVRPSVRSAWSSSAPGEGRRGCAGHHLLRRDGLALSNPRHGISSDMESTIVPQLLAEIDGVESLRDVIVIAPPTVKTSSTRRSFVPAAWT